VDTCTSRDGESALDCNYAFVTVEKSAQQPQSSDPTSRLPNLVIENFEGFLDRQSLSATDRESVLKIWTRSTKPGFRKGVASLLDRPQLESMLRALVYPEIATNEAPPASAP
jgi:hypothetical protein